MHAEHMHCERVRCVAGTEREQGRRHRNSVLSRKTSHRLSGIGIDYAASRVDQGTFGFRQHRVKAFALRIAQAIFYNRR